MSFNEKNFNTLYQKLVKYVLNNGSDVLVRKKFTKECINCLITLKDVNKDYIDFNSTQAYKRQDQYEHYRKREIEWYESGCLKAEHAPAKEWKRIADKRGNIQSNYGYLILHKTQKYKKNKKITSYKNVLELLKNDKFSRQAIFHYNLPEHYSGNKKDIPCTICTQILIRNGKLNFLVFQRSSDLKWGLPYDVTWHCYLLKRIVEELKQSGMKISYGSLSMIFGSVHIYKKDVKFFQKFLKKRKYYAKKK